MAAIVLVGALATVLAVAGSGQAAAPSLFASASGTCPAGSYSHFSTARITGNHSYPLVRLTSQAGPGELSNYGGDPVSFGGPDVIWARLPDPILDGDIASGIVSCADAAVNVPYTVDFFDRPTTPTTFSGATTPTSSLRYATNTFRFTTPAAAHYVVDLSLAQGAVTLDDGTVQQTFASSGRFDLGILPRDSYQLFLTPQDGPQAQWSLAIHALPVALSQLAFDRQYERPTQITSASYHLDGDVSLTATILNSAQQSVRALASGAPVSEGDHSLTWDGLNGSGSSVTDGSYTLAVSYTDAAGNSGAGQASIAVDGTPPTVSVVSPPSLPRTHGLVVEVADNLSGVKAASLSVDGTKVRTLGSGQTQFTYIPSGGWRSGAHSFSVSATDNAGYATKSSGSFSVPAPPARVYAPDCIGKPQYKPKGITLACVHAWVSVGKIHWSRWTRRVATGVGVYDWHDCKPSCPGHFHSAGARLKLDSVGRCKSKGFLEFRRLRVTPPKSAHARPSVWRLFCTFR
jgi:hypothetical protein